jgi:hypothetical protein
MTGGPSRELDTADADYQGRPAPALWDAEALAR